MIRLAGLLLLSLTFAGCAQILTNDEELAELQRQAQADADAYVDCVKRIALGYAKGTDTAYLADVAEKRCEGTMMMFEKSQSKSLNAQYMMISGPLEESVVALQRRARQETAEMVLGIAPAESRIPEVAADQTSSEITGSASTSTVPLASWNEKQRIYLDCMADQANKYATMNESAEVIADVAASRCRDYLTEEARAALEREGRTQVMGIVMDKRLEMPGRR